MVRMLLLLYLDFMLVDSFFLVKHLTSTIDCSFVGQNKFSYFFLLNFNNQLLTVHVNNSKGSSRQSLHSDDS